MMKIIIIIIKYKININELKNIKIFTYNLKYKN